MEDIVMGKFDVQNLAKLKQTFEAADDAEIQPALDDIAARHALELSDIDGLKVICQPLDCFTKVGLMASITIAGKEYALAQIVSDPRTSYAPIIRGWVEKITEA